MNNMFYNCKSLFSLPNISKWNIENVNDLSFLFCKCSSLLDLPDISKWNTKNVTDIHGLFAYCTSLIVYLIFQNRILQTLKI